ncbi:MAG TPA: PadR family transcriptional regulator [Solirubrobacterales bacterium]|nr:PadR family transcriptional regulator [Solirubrobacterales bacterium]
MGERKLTEASYIVLGLLDLNEPATPYDLKQFAMVSVFQAWPLPHSQIYSECGRLAEEGLLEESREEGGRRRRFYKLTSKGRKALKEWRSEPTDRTYEGRFLPALKLFLGTDPVALAEAQLPVHRQRLRELEASVAYPALPEGIRLAAELGINQERAQIRFWTRIAARKG